MTFCSLYIDENDDRHRNISDLMIRAMFKLEYSWSEIDDNLKINNWRNPSSIWGELSRLIFRRNISKYRGKIRHLWFNNRYNIQNRFKTAVLQHKTSITNVNTEDMNLSSPISTNLEQTGYSDANEIMGSQIASSSNIFSQIVAAKTFHETTTCILKENPCEIESNVVSKLSRMDQSKATICKGKVATRMD